MECLRVAVVAACTKPGWWWLGGGVRAELEPAGAGGVFHAHGDRERCSGRKRYFVWLLSLYLLCGSVGGSRFGSNQSSSQGTVERGNVLLHRNGA
jgi:hypothetical protein